MPSKRKSPKSESVAKKNKVAEAAPVKDAIDEDIERLVEAINVASSRGYPIPGPESNVAMLQECGAIALKEFQEDRHPFQNTVIECIREAIDDIELRMTTQMNDYINTRDNVDAHRIHLHELKNNAEKLLEERKSTLESNKVLLTTAKAEVSAKEAVLDEATDDLEEKRQKLTDLEKEEAELREDLEVHLANLNGEFEDVETHHARVMKALKDREADSSMAEASGTALLVHPESRGKFDVMTIKFVQDFFAAGLTKLAEEIVAQKILVTESETKHKEAEDIYNAAYDQRIHHTEDVQLADQAKREANADFRQKEKDINAHERDAKQVFSRIDKLKVHSADFRLAKTLFTLLVARTNVKAVEVVEAKEIVEAPEVLVDEPAMEGIVC